jgi:hypothetical protein
MIHPPVEISPGITWTHRDRINVDRWLALYAGVPLDRFGKPAKEPRKGYPYLPSGSMGVALLEADGWARSLFGVYSRTDPRWNLEWSACESSAYPQNGDVPVEFFVRCPESLRSHRIPELSKRGYYTVFHPKRFPDVPSTLVSKVKSLFPKRFS